MYICVCIYIYIYILLFLFYFIYYIYIYIFFFFLRGGGGGLGRELRGSRAANARDEGFGEYIYIYIYIFFFFWGGGRVVRAWGVRFFFQFRESALGFWGDCFWGYFETPRGSRLQSLFWGLGPVMQRWVSGFTGGGGGNGGFWGVFRAHEVTL